MEAVLAALGLLTRLFEAAKAYFELRSGKETDDHPDARTTSRPKHLRR